MNQGTSPELTSLFLPAPVEAAPGFDPLGTTTRSNSKSGVNVLKQSIGLHTKSTREYNNSKKQDQVRVKVQKLSKRVTFTCYIDSGGSVPIRETKT